MNPYFLCGEEFAEKMTRFDEGIEKIEIKHTELFDENNLHHEFYISWINPKLLRLRFKKSTASNIKKEVTDLFYSIFPKL